MTNNAKPSKEFLQKQIERLRAAYPSQPWDDGQIALYRDCLRRMVVEHGEEKVRLGVDNTIMRDRFLEVALVFQHIPKGKVPRKYCDRCCEREGFIEVLIEGEKSPRLLKCKHKVAQLTVPVMIGPDIKRRQVFAQECDYVDQQVLE